MPSWLRVAAERTVSRAMGGSCSMPLAAYADWQSPSELRLDAAWGDPEEASAMVRVHQSTQVQTLAQAEALGLSVAKALRAGGARGV
jgi:hydroxymethylbilane synthase